MKRATQIIRGMNFFIAVTKAHLGLVRFVRVVVIVYS